MHAIRKFTLASTAFVSLSASSGASAADYLFNFQFDALGGFAATSIVYAADTLDPTSPTYVSGDVNGATSPQLRLSLTNFPGNRPFRFLNANLAAPVGGVADIFFSVINPFVAGQTYETATAGRGVMTDSGVVVFSYTTGRLTITERVAAVPEPATWAMLLIGFMAVGGVLRRRGPLQSVRVAYS